MGSRRGAAIDIGSNTTLFLAGDAGPNGLVQTVDEMQISNGIGSDVFQFGRISADTIAKNVDIINRLSVRASAADAEVLLAAGTSALRNAGNREEFLTVVRERTGIEISVIAGEQEATLSYQGYLSFQYAQRGPVLLIDIGGGSSECVLAENGVINDCFSLDVGAVRLHREFDLGDPPENTVYQRMIESIPDSLRRITDMDVAGRNLIISGGTSTMLAAITRGLASYDGDVVERVKLDCQSVEILQDKFLNMNLTARKSLMRFDPDRAKVIIGGTAIIMAVLKLLDIDSFSVTHRGLRYGLLSEWGKKG